MKGLGSSSAQTLMPDLALRLALTMFGTYLLLWSLHGEDYFNDALIPLTQIKWGSSLAFEEKVDHFFSAVKIILDDIRRDQQLSYVYLAVLMALLLRTVLYLDFHPRTGMII